MDSLRPVEKSMTRKTIGRRFGILLIAMLAGCGESSEEAYERGYNDGQWDVCNELESVAPGVEGRLQNCRGL